MSGDTLGTNCDQCLSMIQRCFASTETVGLVRTGSSEQPPWLSHSSWTPRAFPSSVTYTDPVTPRPSPPPPPPPASSPVRVDITLLLVGQLGACASHWGELVRVAVELPKQSIGLKLHAHGWKPVFLRKVVGPAAAEVGVRVTATWSPLDATAERLLFPVRAVLERERTEWNQN